MGKAFVFGDDINTDAMAPGRYLRAEPAIMASHCLESIDPDFAATVTPGDILVAGLNFGMGSSREQAAGSLKLLGVRAVLARSVARIFYRNAANFGLPVLLWEHQGLVEAGDTLDVDPATGHIENCSRGIIHHVEPLPEQLQAIVSAGGLVPYLKDGLSSGAIVPRSPRP
ncbi:MAG: 3-isopropylmalate/(R)-2-methylmalate dehydratase small subunit [Halieaceae bacterium]|jgi:3-isopropylmalate/(R)-2-methylmalate dehydratase small subunit